MTESPEPTTARRPVLLGRGDVPSLVCALILEQEFGSGIRIRHLTGESDAAAAARESAAVRQAALLDTEPERSAAEPGRPAALGRLLDGLLAAGPEEFLVWPVRTGPDPEQVRLELELAQHLARAVGIALGRPATPIDTPLIDLEAAQVLEMAVDLGAPLEAAWPCEQGGVTPCGTCGDCRLWMEAARSLGQEVPWETPQEV